MYRKALDEGLYSSLRRLAESLGVDVSLVSKSVSLARLPEAVDEMSSGEEHVFFRRYEARADSWTSVASCSTGLPW